jgi:hypothetical protein
MNILTFKKSLVYFTAVKKSDDIASIGIKLVRLIEESNLLDFIRKDELVVIKLHFGEKDNTGYVSPEYLRLICEHVFKKEAVPVLADTNTMYRGSRTNSKDHLQLAYEHGFTPDRVKAKVLIPDDAKEENVQDIHINAKFVRVARIAKLFWTADSLISVAHFKGHMMTGFGGALKNLGMGCATRRGKLFQHSDISPFVIKRKCTGCKACQEVCPAEAIILKDDLSYIDSSKCIGCASCIAVCKYEAINLNWEAGGNLIQEKMVENALAVLSNKKNKAVFFNFCLKITKECDCMAKDDPRIAADVGIFASNDPVAIDKASFDTINKSEGKDIFKEVHPKRDGSKQLHYAAKLGLGNLDYDLITL